EPTLYERLVHQPEVERRFHAGMAAMTLHTVPALLEKADLSDVRHLLDVGGGSAALAARLAERHPHLRISVFDNPNVAGLAASGTSGCRWPPPTTTWSGTPVRCCCAGARTGPA